MALKIKSKNKKPQIKFENSKCNQCKYFIYDQIDSVLSNEESPDNGYCSCEKSELNGKEVRYDKDACINFKVSKEILKNKQSMIEKLNNSICKTCSSFVLPKEKVDSQGFKIDYGFCSNINSQFYKKSILMIQKSCKVYS
jgi:hypothetical protein